MANFDDNVDLMGEWVPRSPSPRTNYTSAIREDKNSNSNSNSNSNRVLERELSLNHGQVISLQDIRNKEKQSIRGGLSERRAGFNAPRLNTENIRSTDFSLDSTVRSPCLTISSPGLSPATLLESPVFLSNPLAQPSPTTGKFPFLPGVNNNAMASSVLEKPKDEFFDDIGGLSFTFHPISRPSSSFFQATTNAKVAQSFPGPEVVSVDYGNYNRSPHSMEDVKPGSQNIENQSLHTNFHETEGDLSGQRASDATNISLEPVEPQEEEQRRGGGCAADLLAGGAPAEDGYNWRKYGQKLVKGSEYPRSYYKCTHPNCQVKKKVERSREGHITEIIYKGAHNHSKPPPNRRSVIGSSGACLDTQVDGSEQGEQQGWTNSTQQAGSNENIEGASPVSTGFEYGNQSGSLHGHIAGQFESGDAAFGSGSGSGSASAAGGVAGVVEGSPTFSNDEDEDDRGTHGSVSLGGYDGEVEESESKRRKLEAYASEMSGATRAIREPRVVVQTTSDVDILEDGYRWRKYGQKVVKGNPNPRSYYKCTAPGCTVRKHVERASHDLKSVITTYEGKHNHDVPAARNSGGSAAVSNSNNGGGSMSQSHYNHHHSEPQRSRFDRTITAPNHHHTSPYGPFSFQPHLGAPGFSFGLGQTGLANLSMPGLGFGQGKLPVMPVHPYLTQQQQQQQQTQQSGIGETQGMMMQRGMEPKVESVSETGIGLSSSSSIYKQLMSRLPHI